MAFSGGVFSRLFSWTNDAAANIDITASRMDAEDNGFATGLSNCILRDGTQTITANLPMSGFIHTGVGNASASNHYAVVGQIQQSSYTWVAGGGTSDAITATFSPAILTLVDGMELRVRATAANTTTTPTFSPNGITAHTITKNGGHALVAGDIAGADHELILAYKLASTRWELQNPALTLTTSAITTLLNGASIDNVTIGGTTPAAGTFTTLRGNTPTVGDSSTKAATTAFVNGTALTLANGTTAITQAFNDSSIKVATTAFVNPSSSLGSSGYQEFASGLLLQWGVSGTISPSPATQSISFTVGFSSAVYSIIITPINSGTGGQSHSFIDTISTSGFTIHNAAGSSVAYYWQAIGK